MIYVFECVKCRRRFEEVRPMARSSDAAYHCDAQAERVFTPPHIIGMFEAYKAIGGDRRIVRTRQEHHDFLRQFGYVEVGNDSSMAPPAISDEEFAHERERRLDEIHKEAKEIQSVSERLAIIPENS